MRIKKYPNAVKATVIGVLTVFAVSACGGTEADTGSTDSIRVAVFPSFNALGPRTAELEGIFEKYDLDVELVTVATPAESTPQLLGGKIEFALTDLIPPILAYTEGVQLTMVAPGAIGTEPDETGMGVGNLWVRADSDIQTVADIENATFGIPQTKGQLWVDIRETVDKAGGDSSKIEFVEVPNTLAALASGSVDVVTTAEPSGTANLDNPEIRRLAPFVNAGGGLAYAYVTTPQYAAEHPEVVTKFRDAIVEANVMLSEQDGLAAEVAATYIEMDPNILDRSMYARFLTEPINEQHVQTAIDRMVRYGLINESDAPTPTDMLVGG